MISMSRDTQYVLSAFEQILREEKLITLIPPDTESVLDIGCRDGSTWNGARKNIEILDGVDRDYKMRIGARDLGFRAVYEDVGSVPSDSAYSLVTCFGILAHVEDDYSFLSALKRFGNIVITVPNADSFHRYVGREIGVIEEVTDLGENEIGYRRYYTYREFMLLMATFAGSSGYSLELGTIGFKISNNDGMLPFFDIAPAINKAARDLGWIGRDAQHGAEIYAKLWR